MPQTIESIALERHVDALFARYTQPGSPGAVVGVMRGGAIELCKGYGLASIELGVPIGPGYYASHTSSVAGGLDATAIDAIFAHAPGTPPGSLDLVHLVDTAPLPPLRNPA